MARAGKQDVAPGAANKAAELSAFASGYFFSKSVHLSKIANHLTKAQRESNVVRLSRFLDNKGVSVDEWYAPQARAVLERLSTAGTKIRVIIGGSKVGFSHQLLMLSVAYRRRAMPTYLDVGQASARSQLCERTKSATRTSP